MTGKFVKMHIGKTNHSRFHYIVNQLSPTAQHELRKAQKVLKTTIPPYKQHRISQNLHMDYGFVQGSDWSKITNDGKLVTSVDNYRSYLLVINRASRYIWIFLTKTKHPPVKQVEGLLSMWKGKYKQCTVTTDQGKELGESIEYQKMVQRCGYILHKTGTDASGQNGLAEKPNQDLARIMQCLLYSLGLGSQFWSYALQHAVYLKNRLPHATNEWKTPYTIMNNKNSIYPS